MRNKSALVRRFDAFRNFLQELKQFLLSFVVLSIHENSSRFPLLGNHDWSLGRLHLSQDLSSMVAEICHRTNILGWPESHIEYLLRYLSKYFSMSSLCRQAGEATG